MPRFLPASTFSSSSLPASSSGSWRLRCQVIRGIFNDERIGVFQNIPLKKHGRNSDDNMNMDFHTIRSDHSWTKTPLDTLGYPLIPAPPARWESVDFNKTSRRRSTHGHTDTMCKPPLHSHCMASLSVPWGALDPNPMPEKMEQCQIECQKECQIECQIKCQIECQNIQDICHDGDHKKSSICLGYIPIKIQYFNG